MGLVPRVLDMTGALGGAFRGSLLEFAAESLEFRAEAQSLKNNPEGSQKSGSEPAPTEPGKEELVSAWWLGRR